MTENEKRQDRDANAEPLIHDEETDWGAISESTVDPPQAGQQDPPDDPTTVDGSG